MRTVLIFGGVVLVLVVVNASVLDKERLLASGTPVLLELAPVDPRSLIQGDYMELDYAISRQSVGMMLARRSANASVFSRIVGAVAAYRWGRMRFTSRKDTRCAIPVRATES
jgi:uncharacterized membrane-anchored protein